LKNFTNNKELLSAGKFIAGIAVFFMLFYFLFSLIPLEWIEFFYAKISLEILKLFGFTGEIIFQEPVLIQLNVFNVPIGISYLCTGLLELTLVWASVLASFGIELKKRIQGVIAGTIVLICFNFIRILSTIIIIALFGLEAGDLSHEFLFKLFLFLTIAGFYYFWFNWATKKK